MKMNKSQTHFMNLCQAQIRKGTHAKVVIRQCLNAYSQLLFEMTALQITPCSKPAYNSPVVQACLVLSVGERRKEFENSELLL